MRTFPQYPEEAVRKQWDEDRAAEYTSLIQSSRGHQSGQALPYRVVNGKACGSHSILQPDGSTSAHSISVI